MELQSKSLQTQARYFEALLRRYHKAEFLRADPLCVVHRFTNAADQEIAALLAALLAYGNVKQIIRSLNHLFALMEMHPAAFVECLDLRSVHKALKTFRHRFHDGQDIATLLWLIRQTQVEFGSLERAFLHFDSGEDYSGALGGLLNLWHSWLGRASRLRSMLGKPSFIHFMASPQRGSACKRWFLFLRWVVRPRDGIDLGLWHQADSSKLLFPVDRHILRIANNIGIVSARSATLKVARAITGFFRVLDAKDPVRFDFALCHLGILGDCPTTPDVGVCEACELAEICQLRTRLASQSKKEILSSLGSALREQECGRKRRAR